MAKLIDVASNLINKLFTPAVYEYDKSGNQINAAQTGSSIGSKLAGIFNRHNEGSNSNFDQKSQLISPLPKAPYVATATPTPQPQVKGSSTLNQFDPYSGYEGPSSPSAQIAPLIESAATQNKIPIQLLAALLNQESQFNPNVIAGPTGNQDRGIAQINEQAFPNVSLSQALDPNFAIPFAAKLLRQNINSFGGDMNRGVAAYNVGPGGAAVNGPAAFGGGATGQNYLDNVIRNLSPELIKAFGFKPSSSLIDELVGSGRAQQGMF
jgi:soluble lytic murein transglycosylase-like protein